MQIILSSEDQHLCQWVTSFFCSLEAKGNGCEGLFTFHGRENIFADIRVWKLEFPRQIFDRYWYIKFHENSSSESRVFPCERTYVTKLIVHFCHFVNAS